MSNLVKIGKTNEIFPGEARVFYVRGNEIVVFNVDGQFYALDNLCPHQGGPLVAGKVDDKVVTCPWHRWQFHLVTGISPVNPSVCVRAYPVQVVKGEIRIKIDRQSPTTL